MNLQGMLEHRARALLDLPLSKRPFLFWALSPLFFFASWIVALVAFRKRQHAEKRFAKKPKPEIAVAQNKPHIQVICVGNVLVGGSGKSPLVRLLAQNYLRQGNCVAIAARGMGVPSGTPDHFVVKAGNSGPLRASLSDENLEHLELLEAEFGSRIPLYICQGGNRRQLFDLFESALSQEHENDSSACFVLDDGLQHVQMPRDLDVCVWDPALLMQAPPACMPVGPYREGFFSGGWGGQNFSELIAAFPVRVWSRCANSPEAVAQFRNLIEQSLGRFEKKPEIGRDLIASANLKLRGVQFSEDKSHLLLSSEVGWNSLGKEIVQQKVKNISVLTGIAKPERFVQNLQSRFGSEGVENVNFENSAFPDHGKWTSEMERTVANSGYLFLTAKDFFRWAGNPSFVRALKPETTFVCVIESVVKTFDGHDTSFAGFLGQHERSEVRK